MQIIVYASPYTALSRSLIDILRGIGDEKEHECHHTLESIAARLRQPMVRFDSLLILCPANGYELTQLTSIGHLLRDMRVIVLLPDEEGKTISEGHMLRPRYVGYADGNLNDVAAVVRKMADPELASASAMAHA